MINQKIMNIVKRSKDKILMLIGVVSISILRVLAHIKNIDGNNTWYGIIAITIFTVFFASGLWFYSKKKEKYGRLIRAFVVFWGITYILTFVMFISGKIWG